MKRDQDLSKCLSREEENMQELQSVNETTEIPSVFYTHVLSGNAALSHPVRFWSLVYMILQQALGQLDPRRVGLTLRVVRCMLPNSEGKVRSLRTSIGLGTPPWHMETPPRLLGSESLAGQALSSYRLMTKEGLADQNVMVASDRSASVSTVACPIEHARHIAGCLLAFSIHSGYFNQTRLALIRNYANLLALAFEPAEFYDLQQLDLRVMPPAEVQERSFALFHRRVADVLAASMPREQLVDVMQAELQVWSQFEEEFCTKS
jgi:hypothetical protein